MTQLKGTPPDVTGRLLAEARQILREAGWIVSSVTVTKAPSQPDETSAVLRVVRQRLTGEGRVALTVVMDRWGKE